MYVRRLRQLKIAACVISMVVMQSNKAPVCCPGAAAWPLLPLPRQLVSWSRTSVLVVFMLGWWYCAPGSPGEELRLYVARGCGGLGPGACTPDESS